MNPVLPPPPPEYARRLPAHPEATTLREVGLDPAGRPVWLAAPTAEAWSQLQTAAAHDGVTLELVSGFRSVDRQAHLLLLKLARGLTLEEALRYTAYPGHSEHHSGRALDLSTPGCPALTEAFAATAAFVWLQQHAGRFGFHLTYPPGNDAGIGYEPWHWCHHPA